jgi:hypothetical protein
VQAARRMAARKVIWGKDIGVGVRVEEQATALLQRAQRMARTFAKKGVGYQLFVGELLRR